ncbi:MAG: hypothetical protein J7J98_05020 [candidate division Zixibacteria bacterium]|nr:hypothetical protein [candidate division Zixibacteria bacterium]
MNKTLRTKGVLLLMAMSLAITAGLTLADEPTKTNNVSDVTTISDTTLAIFARSLAGQDSTSLVSIFPKDIQIAMPEGKFIIGQEKVAKYTPLLFEKFANCKMIYKRIIIEQVVKHDDVVRDVGNLELIRQIEDKVDTAWSGAYTIYWRLADSTWTMERIFVGQLRL